jgi:hypothetical protein
MQARQAFLPLHFSAKQNSRRWSVMFADRAAYDADMARTQHGQIARAGVRLAELLSSIWPG